MTSKSKTDIKAFFETGDKPTQAQFIDLIDSYVDKYGPLGVLETAVSGGSTGFVYASAADADILSQSGALNRLGATVVTTAAVSAVVHGDMVATTAQAIAGTATGVIMNPVLVKNAIGSLGGSASGLTTIASGNLATGSPTVVDITSIPQTYRGLVLYINSASNSVATRALVVRVITTGGSFATADDYAAEWKQISGTTVSDSGSDSLWSPDTQTAAQVTHAVINFPAYQSGPIKQFNGIIKTDATADQWTSGIRVLTHGYLVQGNTSAARTEAIIGIRITWDNVATGVFDAGTYALYGVN